LNTDIVAVIGFVVLFILMLLRVPVGMAMGLVGVTGYGYIVGMEPALKMVGQTTMRTVTDQSFAVIPMFMLMGAFVSISGVSRELFRAANAFMGHLRGGLGVATVLACGGFAAICGSSVATAATFSKVAYPEMRRYNYPKSFATGVIAAGGTLGIMIPPSTVLAVYAILTQQDIGKLFMAGVILYGGLFTPSEAGGMGAAGAFILGVVRRRLNLAQIREALLEATRTSAAVFTVLIGALLFGYFLTITQTPQKITEFLTGMGLGRYALLSIIMGMYLVLGCLMDAMAMIILTVPIIYPLILQLGFDPIWFGVIIVMTVELGLIHPPVGMNVFVIKSVVQDVSFTAIFRGVLPFIGTDLIRLVILIAFPAIALWLPGSMG